MFRILVSVTLVAIALSNLAFAQTLQEAKDQAELEKVKAEAAAAKAAAKKSELELQQADEKSRLALQAEQDKADETKRKALAESITAVNNLKTDAKDVAVTGNAIETKALAYRSVVRVTPQIVALISPVVCARQGTVILADDQAIATLSGYEAGLQTLSMLDDSYSRLVRNAQTRFANLKEMHERKEKSLALAAPLLQGVAAVGAIAQTFRTQLNVSASEVSIDQLALYGALAGSWPEKCATTVLTAYPNLGTDFAASDAARRMNNIGEALSAAQGLESEISLWLIPNKAASAKEVKEIEDAQKTAGERPAAGAPKRNAPTARQKAAAEARKSVIAEVETLLAKLKTDNQRVDLAIQQLVATSEKQPVSAIAQLAKTGRFATAIKQPNAYMLTIKAVAGGGNTVTTNNFWRGPKVFHSGGAVIAFTLLRGSDGAYLGGGVLDSHQGYVQLNIADRKSLGDSWDAEVKSPDKP
jgi:hypothetical protein